ncbi:hypothetical protein ThvES_00017550, partial [Thiovulum sp. ES]
MWVNNLDNISSASREGIELLKDLIKEEFPLFKQLSEDLYYIEVNFIYLNLYLGISQQKIGELFGLSQLGVSKRVHSGLKKLQLLSQRPEKSPNKVREDLHTMLPTALANTSHKYYFLKTFSIVGDISYLSNSTIRLRVVKAIQLMKSLSNIETEYELIEYLSSVHNISKDSHKMKRLLKEESV